MIAIGTEWRERNPQLAASLVDRCGGSAVYFLLDNNEIVYIGASIEPGGRIKAHKLDKQFTHILFLPINSDRLFEVEKYWIGILAPKYNERSNPNCSGKPVRVRPDIHSWLKVIEAASEIQGRPFNTITYLDALIRDKIAADYRKALTILNKAEQK